MWLITKAFGGGGTGVGEATKSSGHKGKQPKIIIFR